MRPLPIRTIVTATVATLVPALAGDVMFNADAQLDVSQVVYVPGERHCLHVGYYDLERTRYGKCLGALIEGPNVSGRNRPDWDAAMWFCTLNGYSKDECEEAVEEGEF